MSLYDKVRELGPVRLLRGDLRPNRAQAILMARRCYLEAYAEVYGAQRGVVELSHGDDIARGIQMGVMRDNPSVTLGDWYDDETRKLAVDAMKLIAARFGPLFPDAEESSPVAPSPAPGAEP